MQSRRGNAVFTLIVGVATFLGGGLMALVLMSAGAPGTLAVGVFLAAIPVMPLIGCYLWLDRYEPEPKSLLIAGLAWGALAATAIALVIQLTETFAFGRSNFWTGVLAAPLSEEAGKGLFIVLLLWFRRSELDGVLDGIVYAGMVGIGFAFTENILYLTSAYVGHGHGAGGLESAVGLFIVRCIFSPFAHPCFTAFFGIGLGLAVNARKPVVRILAPMLGYVAAATAHATWNAAVFYHGGQYVATTYVVLVLPAFAMLVSFAVWVRRREGALLAVALEDCARRGFLNANEIPWLVRIPGRSAARRYAQAVGGDVALRAMKDYQSAAVELGYLHHRYLNGRPPADYALLGQGYLDQMMRLRPYLVWPQAAPLPGTLPGPQPGGAHR